MANAPEKNYHSTENQIKDADLSKLLAGVINGVNITKRQDLTDLELIGQGGYGKVYKATHAEWGPVAYKEIQVEIVKKKEINQLINEVKIHCKLHHSNIVRYLSAVFEPGHYGLVLEYMSIGDMQCYFEENEFCWNRKLSNVHEVAVGMCYLHSQKPPIIHGDLKIDNVLIGDGNKAKICDFGFAQWKEFSQSMSKRRVPLGTITHIPPEHWKNHELRKQESFDAYTFGVFMYEAMTLVKPFLHTVKETLSHHVERGARPDKSLIPADVPTESVEIMEKCWCQNPDGRPTFINIKDMLEGEINKLRVQGGFSAKSEELILKQFDQQQQISDSIVNKDNLKLLHLIGQGTYGLVYKSKLTRFTNCEFVAFKKLPFSSFIKNSAMTEMTSEAEMLIRLNHRCIVKLFGIVLHPDSYGIISEFMENGSLNDFLVNNHVELQQKLIFIYDISSGMEYLHSLQPPVIHGDLKIENILVSKSYKVKVCDFGLSVWKEYLGTLSQTVARRGAVAHIPPEHISQDVLRKSLKFDVYGFGILMWQIFTKKIPYLDMNIFVIFRNVTQGLRPDMNDIPSEVPKSQIEIISSCWDDDQNKRPLFPEVKEMMRSALDEFYFRIKPEKSIVVNKRILGIAWVENTIYVVRIGSRKILAYSDSKPFELMDDAIIRITAMSCPIDITSNHNCQSLFVSDRGNSCLWKIQTSNGDISKHVMDGKLGTLSSTRSDKLLVLLKREVWNLDVYTVTDVSCLKTILFPGQIRKPMRVIESLNENFIVSWRQSKEKMEACSQHKEDLVISEMTEKGNIISLFVYPLLGSINSTFFDFPGYLSLDERHNIFCTDPISNKLIMLDSQLSQLTNSQDLLKYETDHITNPTRLCYVPNKQQLIVGQWSIDHGELSIFCLCPNE